MPWRGEGGSFASPGGDIVASHEVLLPKVKAISPLHILQSIMPECQCVYVVVQDPSLVVRASHKGLSLLLCADVEGLVVDTLESAFDHCHLPSSLLQGRACTARCSLRSFYPRQSRRCEVLPLLHCVRRAFHQSDSTSFGPSPTNSVMRCPLWLILEYGSRQLLVEIEE